MVSKYTHRLIALLMILPFLGDALYAQIPRQRADTGSAVEDVFWAYNIIGTSSVTNLPKGNLNVTIMHAFGIVTDGVKELFGLDGTANIRFGIDYGLHNRLSVGLGRSRFDKLYDVRFKANVLRQTQDGKIPVEVAVKGDLGIVTLENGFDFKDRLNYVASLMIARKFTEQISLQITPIYAHFNTVFIQPGRNNTTLEEENDHLAIGLAGRFVLNDYMALVAEYLPVLGTRSDGTQDAFAIGLDLDTGGHIFQLFLTTSQWFTEQHIIAKNTDSFGDGDFRFGFNVNRVFGPNNP